MTSLAGLLGDVRPAAAFRYDASDSLGNRMDTAKVIASPTSGYLAVYHSDQVCHLATSTASPPGSGLTPPPRSRQQERA